MVDFEKIELNNNTLTVFDEDGFPVFIPEQDATEAQQVMFAEFRAKYPNGKPVVFSLETVRSQKIAEMNSTCEDKIINEFYSTCLGDSRRFDCTDRDQANIQGLVAKAQLILSGMATDTLLDWKESGVAECYPFTTTQAIMLGSDLFNHITEKKKRYEKLKVYILKQTDIEVVKSVTWDSNLEGDISES